MKPWITVGLLRCIRTRDKMHYRLKRDPSNEILKITYKRYRNFCNNILKKCKRNYEQHEIKTAGRDNKKIWNAIKNINNLNKPKNKALKLLKIKNTKLESINSINTFFANVGSELANKIAPSLPQISNFNQSSPNVDSFVLLGTYEDELQRLISGLNSDCGPGHDGISPKVLKCIKDVIISPLTYIFNRCLSEGVFPASLKKSIVIPIFKSGDSGNVSNYRPISILTSLSKLLEKIINNQLVKYIENKKIISAVQYGFRKGRSTNDAVHALTNFLVHKIDGRQKCLTIFIDLKKAFDTVSPTKLIEKLEKIGIRGTQLQLFINYLENRYQLVKIDTFTSEENLISFGVPQGSVLGPTLFLCYINDLCNLNLKNCKIISYADDTTLTFYGDDWEEVFSNAQSGFNTVSDWMAANFLTLNVDKTHYITFSIRNTLNNTMHHKLYAHSCKRLDKSCTCPAIIKARAIKYLGITIDQNLNFKEHIKNFTQKVRKLTYIFKNLRHIADWTLIRTIYISLCQSVLSYGISVWGGSGKSCMLEIERAQRMILKVALSKSRLFPTVNLYKEAKVLTVRQLYILFTILGKHKSLLISNTSTFNSDSRRSHRVCNTLCVKTSFAQKFYDSRSAKLYNKINKQLAIAKITTFECKKKVTDWLLDMNYDDTEKLLQPY